jgi:hypothetical protein
MRITRNKLLEIIQEEVVHILAEQGSEQLELPGIPAGDPGRRAQSLETAKIILGDALRRNNDEYLVDLVFAAPRVVDGLSAPLPGLKDARTRIMMNLKGADGRDANVDINPEIAEEVLGILKQHEATRNRIEPLQRTLAGVLKMARKFAAGGEGIPFSAVSVRNLRGQEAFDRMLINLKASGEDALEAGGAADVEAELDILREQWKSVEER